MNDIAKLKSIVFGEFHPWDAPVKVGGHHYARHFTEMGWRVLWLANFLNWNRLIRRSAYDQLYLTAWKKGIAPVGENLYTYTPFTYLPYIDLPFFSSLAVGQRSLAWCWPSLKANLTQHQFDIVDVLWISQPRMYSLVNIIKHRKLVYRMFDSVEHFHGEPHSIRQIEALLCSRADVVFATSQPLVKKAKQWTHQVVYLPNGADLERFTTSSLTMPADLSVIPAPRLLYVGAIAEWFDFDLLAEVSGQRPDCSFILIGPVDSKVEAQTACLNTLPNVHFLGYRSPEQVPAYMKYSDIGLIPFRITELTHSVSPIKLYEYCAAGLPVIAAKLNEIESAASPALLYQGPQEFMDAINRALTDNTQLIESALQFARMNSWDSRFRKACEFLL